MTDTSHRWGGGGGVWEQMDRLDTIALEIGGQPKYRCLFCGKYTIHMKELIDHFNETHGSVL